MALVTKQSVADIYSARIQTPGLGTFTVDSGSNPGATRINTALLGNGVFPTPGTAQFDTTIIDGSEINIVFYVYARYLTTIRPIRHGFIVDNYAPDTPETTTDDTNTTADMIQNTTYKDDSLVPTSGIAGTPSAGNTISLTNLRTYADNVYAKAAQSLSLGRIDLRVCHSSCHNSCHGSRGRR